MGPNIMSASPSETTGLAELLGPLLRPGDVIVLSGQLGAGKTWFSNALLGSLGVRQYVHSPTFALVNEYDADHARIYHADFYRLDDVEELWAAGWEDYLDGQALLLIEWGERFLEALPNDYLQLVIVYAGDNQRMIEIKATGARSQELREEWLDAVARN